MGEKKPREVLALLDRIGGLWATYLKGQLLLAGIVGTVTWIVGAAIGLAWPLPLGITAGLLQTIPSVGPIIALLPALVAALVKGSSVISVENWVFGLIVVGSYMILQQASALFLEPRLLGKRVNLPWWAVLISVMVGAAVGGVIGAYLAVPMVASLREIGAYLVTRYRRSHRPRA